MNATPDLEHLFDHIALIALILRPGEHAGPEAEDAKAMLAALQARIAERARVTPELAATALERRIALSATEMHVVWFLAAVALRAEVRRIVAGRIDGDGELTLDTIRALVYGAKPSALAFAELGPNGALRSLGILERTDHGPAHESRQTWGLARRVVGLLHGDRSIDPGIAAISLEPGTRACDRLAISPSVLAEARRACRSGRMLVVATGLPGLGRRSLLGAAAREAGVSVHELDARKLASDPAALVKQLRALAFECKLLARTPLLANIDALADDKDSRLDLVGRELAPLIEGLILATCGARRPAMRWDRPVIEIEMGQPTGAQRATLWHGELGQGSAADATHLASRYPLAPALIHHAAEAAKARAMGRPLEPEDLYAGIRSILDDRLGQFAKRVTVTQTWDDLVLAADQLDPIIELMARVRERPTVYEHWGFAAKVGKGLGVTALFSGPPGTGKTMVAALIARELGLEVYQVDMSKIVSKWIGETEKNLAALFDAAEAGHAILLFDEADALFGKRTDVKSSNDRHANLETNYLLQRLESFTGICFLTSNHARSMDPAFQRRLSLHVRFELPDQAERAQLWTAMLPKAAPVAPVLDMTELARRFAMSGGYIRNATLRAAFLAADEGTEITEAHLERAARVEYEGMGRLAA